MLSLKHLCLLSLLLLSSADGRGRRRGSGRGREVDKTNDGESKGTREGKSGFLSLYDI